MFPAAIPHARALVLMAEAEPFRVEYLRHALHEAGIHLLGPVRNVAEGQALLGNLRDQPVAAIVNLRLEDGSALPLIEALDEADVPLLLIGEAGMAPSPLLRDRAMLLAPFAAYQVVAAVRQLIAVPLATPMPPLPAGFEQHG